MAPKYLADHRDGECIFPLKDEPPAGDMSRQLFCCEPAEAGACYCADHAKVVYLGHRK